VRRILIAAMVLIIAIALFVGLHPLTPARTADDYAHKAKDTAESVLSSVETARLTTTIADRGKAFGPYVSVLLSESEVAAGKAQSAFDSVQPPDRRSDATRDRLGRLLDRTNDALSELRISARRGELDRLAERAMPLRRLARQLNEFIEDPGPRAR
jgi:hypothetical protein